MAAPLALKTFRGFSHVFYLLRPNTSHHINPYVRCSSSSSHQRRSKSLKKKSNRSKDPRFNIQYPYVRGDPLHEMQTKETTSMGVRLKNEPNRDVLDLNILQKQKTLINSMAQFTTDSGLTYTKLKDGDIRLGRTILSIKSKLGTNSSTSILLEGQRLIRDSLLLGAELKCLYFSEDSLLHTIPTHLLKDIDLFKVAYRDLKTWLDTTTPSGIMGIFKKPDQGEMTSTREDVLPITLILDGVKDPGNAGTLIRTAAAVGCDKILAIKGCVNMWEGKVLRSGMGGHFAIPIYTSLQWPQIHNYVHENSQVFLAEPKPVHHLLSQSSHDDNLHDRLEAHEIQEMNESDSSDSSDEDESVSKRSSKRYDDRLFHSVPFPSRLYSDINLQTPNTSCAEPNTSHISLVIGGETKGLSASSKKFAYDYYGQYISLPMAKNIDSLNTAVSASVILYELRRKLLSRKLS